MSTSTMEPVSLEQVGAMGRDEFVATFGSLFEHSPWVAAAAWRGGPFSDADDLHAAMMAAVRAAAPAEQIAFFRLHPELAGQEAEAGTLTDHSTLEQRGGGMAALSAAELAELRRLNAAYAARHGFPFIIAVLGHSKAQIFAALRERAAGDTEQEIREALQQIGQITRRRLQALFAGA